jgi:hypothetical protein
VELIGLLFIAAALLVVAGTAKTIRPDDTARALRARVGGRWSLRWPVRLGAVCEAALGLVTLAWPRPVPALLVAFSYLGFAAYVLDARRRGGPLATCGCFGRADTPADGLHLLLNVLLALAAVSVAATTTSGATLTSLLHRQPWSGWPLVLGVAAGIFLVLLALSVRPQLVAARRLARGDG